jgi:hypothetical protein
MQKQPKIHMKIHTTLWILEKTRKKSVNHRNRDFGQMFEIFKKKIIPQGMDLKVYKKSKKSMDFYSL